MELLKDILEYLRTEKKCDCNRSYCKNCELQRRIKEELKNG